MRAVVQRVKRASVDIDGVPYSNIERGLLVLLGVSEGDCGQDIDFIIRKMLNLRIFEDDQGKQNLSVLDISGQIMVVSQFTLLGDARKGNRPNYTNAMEPEKAKQLYNEVVDRLKEKIGVATGEFGAMMDISLVNEGPVTILLDSRRNF